MSEPYAPREYWTEIANAYSQGDGDGLAPVLHPNVPDWYNRIIDRLQHGALLRALDIAKLDVGSQVLDIGCGTGRWLRRYEGLGYRPTGIDLTAGMLSLARKNRTRSPLVGGESCRLPFKDASFDAVSDITVIQHQLPASQPRSIAEMLRVLKPGGRLILIELIRGKGNHIFPLSPRNWINLVTSAGATLVDWFGQEFMLMDRAFVTLARLLVRGRDHQTISLQAVNSASLSREMFWKIRRLSAIISARIDPTVGRIFPGKLATHAVFIFVK
ncbi:MAG TPA: class I SAM-dependent methyltransferase [Chthoniobacterales bacterium]|nr:class I SAM-dependent methyltransferase [Chthoniobacterales bacterium]